jgi:hypothetical protein
VNPNQWTGRDLRTVTSVGLGNTIWLCGALWLVLDLLLNVAGFWTCLFMAVLICWALAIWRQSRVIDDRILPTAH